MKKLKILIITNSYPSFNGPTNQIFVRKQAEKLIEFGHRVTVLATYGNRIFPFSILQQVGRLQHWSTIPFEDMAGLVVQRMYVPIFPKKWLSYFYGMVLGPYVSYYLNRNIRNTDFDLIHAHVADYAGFIGKWLGNNLNIPFVITTHGADTDSVIHKSRFHRSAIQKCFHSADKVICVSKRIQKHVFDLGIPKSKAAIVRNGINIEDILYDPHFLKSKYDHKPIILSVSHLLETKGLHYNLEALRRILDTGRDVFYVIVGGGPFEAQLKRIVDVLKLKDHVAFEGPLKHEEVMRYMSACDIFSMPSWQESFGIVYLEAMLNGKAIIGDVTQGIADIITHGANGYLVPSHDVDALTLYLTRLIDNKALAIELGNNGKNFVIKQLTWKRSAAQLCRIYEQVYKERKTEVYNQ